MNNLDLIIQSVFMIISSGVIGYVGHYLNKHRKAKHFANGLEHAQALANTVVARVATDSQLAMGQRRMAVVRELQTVLDSHGYHFDVKRLEGIAEYAYQIYKQNGFKIVAPVKIPAPNIDNTTDGPNDNQNVKTIKVSNDERKLLDAYRSKNMATA